MKLWLNYIVNFHDFIFFYDFNVTNLSHAFLLRKELRNVIDQNGRKTAAAINHAIIKPQELL